MTAEDKLRRIMTEIGRSILEAPDEEILREVKKMAKDYKKEADEVRAVLRKALPKEKDSG